MSEHADTKRLMRNTLMLYFRMLLSTCIGLYTSRIVLEALGIDDFGIYNVVGGIVTLLAFLNTSMSRGTERFLLVELGKKDFEELKKTFALTVTIHCGLALVILIFAETLGLWFINAHLNVPAERMCAVNWVYQCSVFSFIVGVLQVPYMASIVARERMSIYAYVSLGEAALKLLLVFLLTHLGGDKLIIYALLCAGTSFVVAMTYRFFCRILFEECRFRFYFDAKKAREIVSFTGWSLVSHFTGALSGQGTNILLNQFFGPAVNAARGIAFQVSGTIQNFVSNFQTAAGPQIVKTHVAGEIAQERALILKTCRLSFFLLMIFAIPVILECGFILKIWLVSVPAQTEIFLQIIIIQGLVTTSALPMFQALMATGNIRAHQIGFAVLHAVYFAGSYAALYIGATATSVFLLGVIMEALMMCWRVLLLKKQIQFSVRIYFRQVVIPAGVVFILAGTLPLFIHLSLGEGWLRLLAVGISSLVCCAISIFFFGVTQSERKLLLEKSVLKFRNLWRA